VGCAFNGGNNTGGGATTMSTDAFVKKPNAQSTLEQELGHTVGLPHVISYGIETKLFSRQASNKGCVFKALTEYLQWLDWMKWPPVF
jgi:hypothetical protein